MAAEITKAKQEADRSSKTSRSAKAQFNKKMKEMSCKESDYYQIILVYANEVLAVHTEKSGFDGIDWGANPHGIHLAAGPDWMHLMLEGLGKHILKYTTMI